MKRILSALAGAALLASAGLWSVQALAVANVAITKHNLSVTGPGTIKATAGTETQTCVFCHIPHLASNVGALWNRRNPAAAPAYIQYTSSTTKGTMGQPNGASLLCLSCHDGTIALGELLSRTSNVTMAGASQFLGNVGTYTAGRDLSDDHPVSFAYNAALATAAAGELATPVASVTANNFYVGPAANRVRLDGSSQMQCTSCHDPHDNTYGKMLVMNNAASALCVTCHTKAGWATSDHATHTNTYSGVNITFNGTNYGTGAAGTPWKHTSGTTVAANACENCHQPHTAPGAKRILNYLKEEDNCLVCHNGSAMSGFTAKNNIAGEYSKASAHTQTTMGLIGIHDPTEAANVATKHVECVDCHNPHKAQGPASLNPVGNALALPLTGVRGVTTLGVAVASVTREDEICYRCHGDTAATTGATRRVTRQIVQGNTRLEFQTSSVSYHPVVATGKGTNVPSLIAGFTTASTMKCTHCHNNNAGPIVGVAGAGPNGPHASTFTPILNKNFDWVDTGTNSAYNATRFALCYTCHSETLIHANSGPFREHATHLDIGASCSTCHDPHGVAAPGTATNNAHLINFNTATGVVTPSNGILRYISTGTGAGSCQLVCHGKNHNPFTY